MLPELTEREAGVLAFLERRLRRFSVPSYSEIAQAIGLSSKGCVVANVLCSLEDKGYIKKERGKQRSLSLVWQADGQPFHVETVRVPLVGTIAAGEPIPVPGSDEYPYADEMVELTRALVGSREGVYALKVKGDSMIDALVSDGDIVIMRHQPMVNDGEMAAVWLKNGEGTTLKYFHHEGDRIRLDPANPKMAPFYYHPSDVEIQGKVLTVIRRLV
jgi:repressor LexA